jgi:aspartate kinase
MKVFKFGGASVKDASGVKNLVLVLNSVGHKDTLVVVSAMGKTTNALEKVIEAYFEDKSRLSHELLALKEFHLKIVEELFEKQGAKIAEEVHGYFEELQACLRSSSLLW